MMKRNPLTFGLASLVTAVGFVGAVIVPFGLPFVLIFLVGALWLYDITEWR